MDSGQAGELLRPGTRGYAQAANGRADGAGCNHEAANQRSCCGEGERHSHPETRVVQCLPLALALQEELTEELQSRRGSV